MNYLCKLISRNVGIINKFKYIFSPEIFYNIYNALNLSYISYGILDWGNTSSFRLKRILVLQNRALRIIDHVDYRAHIIRYSVTITPLKLMTFIFFNWEFSCISFLLMTCQILFNKCLLLTLLFISTVQDNLVISTFHMYVLL